jgi:adenine-specific DNA glycosylase
MGNIKTIIREIKHIEDYIRFQSEIERMGIEVLEKTGSKTMLQAMLELGLEIEQAEKAHQELCFRLEREYGLRKHYI